MKFGKKALLFVIGGLSYVGVELLWRGRSHQSMFLAGGVCFLLLGALGKKTEYAPIQALAGAGVITAVELLTGLIVNRGYQVWDYREMPYNYRGQICLGFSLLWIPLSLCAVTLYQFLERKLKRRFQ